MKCGGAGINGNVLLFSASAPPAAHRVRASSFVKRLRSEASSGAQERRSSLATEAISSQLSAISAFNRILALVSRESSKRFTFHEDSPSKVGYRSPCLSRYNPASRRL